MLPTFNLLRPADGSPVTTPATKEMALGVYFLTSENKVISPYRSLFADPAEAICAYQNQKVHLRQKITVRRGKQNLETTVGRLFFNEVLPEGFDFVNEAVTSATIKQLLTKAYNTQTHERVVEMIDAIKDLGFWAGTASGLSFGIADACVLPEKRKMITGAEAEVADI